MAFEKEYYRGLKLRDPTLKIIERVLWKFKRQIININKIQFGFMAGHGTRDAIFI